MVTIIRRNTNQRQIVYDAINDAGHITTERLIEVIQENNDNISLATIYRNIATLLDDGIIKRVKLADKDVLETVKHKHFHYVCRVCGDVVDVDPKGLAVDVNKIKQVQDFKVDEIEVSFYGLCAKCKEGQGEKINE